MPDTRIIATATWGGCGGFTNGPHLGEIVVGGEDLELLQPRHALREFARQARKDFAIDRNAASLHPRQRNNKRRRALPAHRRQGR